MTCHTARLRRVLLGLIGVCIPWSCSRTGLLELEPCEGEGEVRSCSNRCGRNGSQTCLDGAWQRCIVPAQQVPCRNVCGEGLAQCADDVLGECVVTTVPVEACTTDCGSGERSCRDGQWGACEYTGAPRPCSDDCGEGTQACVKGKWAQCEVPRWELPCTSVCGSGKEICENNRKLACDAPQPLPPKLNAIIRDFTPETNPDFENASLPRGDVLDRGAILPGLGADGLPVFAGDGPSKTISGLASFDQWFRDVPGVNLRFEEQLQLLVSPGEPGIFVYEDDTFFPIDGRGFGDTSDPRIRGGYSHNYHFTLMVETRFHYIGGEMFSFSGDDDMWVFINRKLAIDLGGVHTIQTASVKLDDRAEYFGISRGNTYPLHFFFAERRMIGSNFMIRTSIADLGSCP